MSSDDSKPPLTEEEKERRRARFEAARKADAALGEKADDWVEELPDAPPLDTHTTALFIRRRPSGDEGDS